MGTATRRLTPSLEQYATLSELPPGWMIIAADHNGDIRVRLPRGHEIGISEDGRAWLIGPLRELESCD